MMLAGYAFENLLKGVYVGRKGNQISETQLPEELDTHNLVLLAQKLGLDLTSREIDLLNRLKATVVWRGRYPVPKNHTQIIAFEKKTTDPPP